MIRVGLWEAFFLSLFLLLPRLDRAQLVVFENSAQYSGYFAHIADEYGDEITLAGNARVVTKLRFEYVGDFFPEGNEAARLRIYANTGPDWKGNSAYPTPAGPLWESPIFPITQGFHVQEVQIPSIRVPDKFTWTVQFFGVSMATNIHTVNPAITNDVAGLLFYGTPNMGVSFNDFWQRLTEGWTPVRVDGPPKNNFSVSVTAIPEAVVPRLRFARQGTFLRLSWPATAGGYNLQYKPSSSTQWLPTAAPALIGDSYERLLPFSSSHAIFELKNTNQLAPTSLNITLTNGTVRIRWPASATGFVLQGRSPLDSGAWLDQNTPGVPVGDFFEFVRPAGLVNQFYRLKETILAASLEIINEGENLRIRWPKAAVGYTLQESAPLSGAWSDVGSTVTISGSFFESVVPKGSTSKIFRLRQ